MLDMIERLLLEADLEDQLPKLEVGIQNKCLIILSWVTGNHTNSSSQSITHDNIKRCILVTMKMFCDKVYGKTIDGIKDLLRFLLSEPSTGRALKRQVAFLFFFLLFSYFFTFYFLFFRQVGFLFFYVIFLLLFSIFLGKLLSSSTSRRSSTPPSLDSHCR